jgi:hypothetical protein
MRFCEKCAVRLGWPFNRSRDRDRARCGVCDLSYVECARVPVDELPVPNLGERKPDVKQALHEVFVYCKSQLAKAWDQLLLAVGDHAAMVARREAIAHEGWRVINPEYYANDILRLAAKASEARKNWCERFVAFQKVATWLYGRDFVSE